MGLEWTTIDPNKVTLVGVLLTLIILLISGQLVPGYVYKQRCKELVELKETSQQASDLAARAVEALRRIIKQNGDS